MNNTCRLQIILLLLMFFTQANSLEGNANSVSSNTNGTHNYYYNDKSLDKVLAQIASNNNLNLNIASDISSKTLKQTVNGRITATSMDDLLDTLGQNYGFKWFSKSGGLFISSNRQISKAIEVSGNSIENIQYILKAEGVLNDKFGFSALPSENKIIISGPENYVNGVVSSIKELKISPATQGYAVFHLKYAKADDITMNFNGQNILIPGIASILRALNGNIQSSGTYSGNAPVNLSTKIQDYTAKESGATPIASSDTGSLSRATIQADVRFNTIIIRDSNTNLKIYKNLIDKLDVAAPIIQIDVLMVNLDQDKLSQSGVDWTSSLGKVNISNNAGGISQATDLFVSYNQISNGQAIIGDVGSFVGAIKFLQSNNYAKTINHPSLATIDNIPAITNVTQNVYLPSTATDSNNGNNIGNDGYTPVQVVTALEIIPHLVIGNDNQRKIMLSINLQDGKINDTNINKVLVNTEQSTINSQVVIPEGKSVLLSGYTKNHIEEIKSQIPFLGSIPLLGWFFKSDKYEYKKITTLYIVTPKVIENFDLTDNESAVNIKYGL